MEDKTLQVTTIPRINLENGYDYFWLIATTIYFRIGDFDFIN